MRRAERAGRRGVEREEGIKDPRRMAGEANQLNMMAASFLSTPFAIPLLRATHHGARAARGRSNARGRTRRVIVAPALPSDWATRDGRRREGEGRTSSNGAVAKTIAACV